MHRRRRRRNMVAHAGNVRNARSDSQNWSSRFESLWIDAERQAGGTAEHAPSRPFIDAVGHETLGDRRDAAVELDAFALRVFADPGR